MSVLPSRNAASGLRTSRPAAAAAAPLASPTISGRIYGVAGVSAMRASRGVGCCGRAAYQPQAAPMRSPIGYNTPEATARAHGQAHAACCAAPTPQLGARRPARQPRHIVRAGIPKTSDFGEELSESNAAILEGLSGWRRRWTIVGLCFFAFMLCNMDRVNMAVAILPMSQQFGWDSATVGLVQSSFFWGYLLTQVLGGIWADRYGGKLVLGVGVIWWSLATALTPVAASMGLVPLLCARCLMGIGEGVAMPAMNNMLSRWVPVKERSRSLSLVYSGMFVGSIIGLSVSPQLIVALGWPSVFQGFGSLGIFWFMAWQARARSTPSEDPGITEAEAKYIAASTPKREPGKPIPWKKLLTTKEVWTIIVCHFCHNWGTFILLTWMPTYYNKVLGLDLMHSGVLSVLPWVTMAIMANVGGYIADSMVERGVSVTKVRKVMQTLGFLGPAFFLSQLSSVDSAWGAVLCMMGAQGFDAFSQSGLYSNHQDIGPRYAGLLLGMSNTAGVLAGVLGSLVTGLILQHGTWDQVWGVAIMLYLIGTVIWNLFATGEKVLD